MSEYWVISYQCQSKHSSSQAFCNLVINKDPLTWLSEVNEKYGHQQRYVLLNCFITSAREKAAWCVKENGGEI